MFRAVFVITLAVTAVAHGDDYAAHVKPLLMARCIACHGALKQKAGLRLDTLQLLKKGGDSGSPIVVGKGRDSLLIQHIEERDGLERMPPEGEGEALKPAEIAMLIKWIDAGAAGPADEKPEADPREHWAFRAPVRPAVTTTGNPIDALLEAEWKRAGVTPQAPADPRILLRRVHLDLVGLPPTSPEIDAFVAAAARDRQKAVEAVVDELLSRKQYGERWGRHWMDIWRYSDWWGLGAEVRNSQKHMWHWRDWIIESLNADKGYDQMVREMIAGDELYPTDADKLRGGGYLARQYFRFNRNTWMEETVEHTSKAFMGMTFNCSKCHDHKYDPLSQKEFYQFRAFFEPYQVRLDMVPGQADFDKDGIPRGFDCHLDAPTYIFTRGDEKQPRKDQAISAAAPAIFGFDMPTVKPVNLPLDAHMPGLRPTVIDAQRRLAGQRIEDDVQALSAMLMKLFDGTGKQATIAVEIEYGLNALTLSIAKQATTEAAIAADRARFTMAKGDATMLAQAASKAERRAAALAADLAATKLNLDLLTAAPDKKEGVQKKLTAARDAAAKAHKDAEPVGDKYTSLKGAQKTFESPTETEAQRSVPFPTTSTGRRTALASWLTDSRHPLVARVAANHIWARHFGKPLVSTVFDFGRKGSLPTHPEVLDYLAVELRDNGWSMKKLHRLICTSKAYQMSSSAAGAESNVARDAENRFLWRMHPTRMEAQVIRDSLLALAGELDLTPGGPSIPAADETSKRRSLYFFHSHNEHQKFLLTFDDANVLECYRRAESIVPQQALSLENSKLAMAAAEAIARKLSVNRDEAAFTRIAFELLLGSLPSADESSACADALKQWADVAARDRKPDPALRARINLVLALINHNDFITIR